MKGVRGARDMVALLVSCVAHLDSASGTGKGKQRKGLGGQTVMQVGEELCKEVLRHDTDVGLDMVVEDQARREGRLVLPASTQPSPADDTRVRSWHSGRFGEEFAVSWQVKRVVPRRTRVVFSRFDDRRRWWCLVAPKHGFPPKQRCSKQRWPDRYLTTVGTTPKKEKDLGGSRDVPSSGSRGHLQDG